MKKVLTLKLEIKNFFVLILYFLLLPNYSFSIKIDKENINFNTVKKGEVVSSEINITNDSEKILNLLLRSSCDCLEVTPQRIKLLKGESIKVGIKLFTQDYEGKIEKKVFVQSNDSQRPYFFISIVADIISTSTLNSMNIEKLYNINKSEEFVSEENLPIVPITIFSSKGCKFCIKLKTEIIPNYEKILEVRIVQEEFYVDEPKNYEILLKLEQQFGKQLDNIPIIFIGENVVSGKKEIIKNLPNIIQECIKKGGCEKISIPEVSQKEVNIKRLRLLPVILAGLIDSVNPCAFATIIFLLTYLSMMLKKKKGEILLIGTTFVFGVFITYFLIGLGMFKFIYKINQIFLISKFLYIAIGIFTLYASYEHFIEALKIKKGVGIADDTIKMRLPNKIRWKIYSAITKFTKLKYLLPSVFLLAVAITLLELFCTGQIYLPTIMYMVKIPQHQTMAIFYLLLYSLIFVIPLIVIFLLFGFGLNLDDLETYFRGKIYVIKFIMSGFFLFLTITVFVFIFK